MNKTIWKSKSFYGVKITPEDEALGAISYSTLAKAFNCVLCNEILETAFKAGFEPELINGPEEGGEIFQLYIVDEAGAELLQELTNENLYYIDELGVYVWGVTHFGSPWAGVPTEIKLEKGALIC